MAASLFKNPFQFKKVLENKKGATVIFIIGVAGIILICLSSFISGGEGKKKSNESAVFNMDTYTMQLENRLSALVQNINGAGKTSVFVTLESGPEYIYATKEKQSADLSESSKTDEHQKSTNDAGENEYIIIETGDGQKALLVTELAPRVKGVAVVCKNGDNSAVAERVKNAVATALNISANKVIVTGSK